MQNEMKEMEMLLGKAVRRARERTAELKKHGLDPERLEELQQEIVDIQRMNAIRQQMASACEPAQWRLSRKEIAIACTALLMSALVGAAILHYSRGYASAEDCMMDLIPKARNISAVNIIRNSCSAKYYTLEQLRERR